MKLRRSAFTLIELVVVIAIIAIMGAVAPFITSGAIIDRQMYNAATQLQQDLLLLQNQAITYSSGGPNSGTVRFAMRLYLGSNAFAYQSTENALAIPSTPATANGVVLRTMPSTLGFPAKFGKPSPASVRIGSTDVLTGYVDVVFDNQGLPYWANNGAFPGAASPIAGSIMIVTSSLSKQIEVDVSPIGRVTIEWVKP